MDTLANIVVFIIESLGTLFLLFVILRFFLQLARADFYNPFSQAIVKVTNPILIPLRRVIPGIFGIDLASVCLAILVQFIIGEAIALVLTHTLFNPLTLLVFAILGTLKVATYILIGCILVMVVTSFVAPHSSHPAILLARQLVDPLTRPIQKFIPPAGGLDFSVFFVGMGIYIVQMVLDGIAASVGLLPILVIGF